MALFVQLDTNWPDNGKVARAGLEAAGLHAVALCIAKRTEKNGWIDRFVLERYGPAAVVDRLIEFDLLEVDGEDVRPVGWHERNLTQEAIETHRTQKSQSGRLGNHRRYGHPGDVDECAICNPMQESSQNLAENPMNPTDPRRNLAETSQKLAVREGASMCEPGARKCEPECEPGARKCEPDLDQKTGHNGRSSQVLAGCEPVRSLETESESEVETESEEIYKAGSKPEPLVLTDVPPAVSIDEQFGEFWEIWTPKKNRAGALKAYTKALKTADHETIITGARRYMEYQNRRPKPGEFIAATAHAATWLNNQRWDDELDSGPESAVRRTPSREGVSAVLQSGNVKPLKERISEEPF